MTEDSTGPQPAPRYRFGIFEVDAATGELRRQGLRVKLNTQPFQVLLMLLDRAGQLLTREEISRELWPDGTFVDYEHGLNSAINRIREALGDTAPVPASLKPSPVAAIDLSHRSNASISRTGGKAPRPLRASHSGSPNPRCRRKTSILQRAFGPAAHPAPRHIRRIPEVSYGWRKLSSFFFS